MNTEAKIINIAEMSEYTLAAIFIWLMLAPIFLLFTIWFILHLPECFYFQQLHE